MGKVELMRAPNNTQGLRFEKRDNVSHLQQPYTVIYQDNDTLEVTQEIVYFDVPEVNG